MATPEQINALFAPGGKFGDLYQTDPAKAEDIARSLYKANNYDFETGSPISYEQRQPTLPGGSIPGRLAEYTPEERAKAVATA